MLFKILHLKRCAKKLDFSFDLKTNNKIYGLCKVLLMPLVTLFPEERKHAQKLQPIISVMMFKRK